MLLEIENTINLTMVINDKSIYWDIQLNPEIRFLSKGDLVGSKSAEKIANVASKSTCENPSKSHVQIDETLTQSTEILKKKNVSSERQQQIIDKLWLLHL